MVNYNAPDQIKRLTNYRNAQVSVATGPPLHRIRYAP